MKIKFFNKLTQKEGTGFNLNIDPYDFHLEVLNGRGFNFFPLKESTMKEYLSILLSSRNYEPKDLYNLYKYLIKYDRKTINEIKLEIRRNASLERIVKLNKSKNRNRL